MKPSPRSILMLSLAVAANGGCSAMLPAAALVAPNVVPPFRGAKVLLEGLEFLDLYMPHLTALDRMRQRGYTCRDEAATGRYTPCTRTDHTGPQAVVLAFENFALAAVRTEVVVTDKDPRDQFDRIYAAGRKRYPRTSVEQHELFYRARFLPGDGSVVELRYFIFADAMETEHRAPAPQIALASDAQ